MSTFAFKSCRMCLVVYLLVAGTYASARVLQSCASNLAKVFGTSSLRSTRITRDYPNPGASIGDYELSLALMNNDLRQLNRPFPVVIDAHGKNPKTYGPMQILGMSDFSDANQMRILRLLWESTSEARLSGPIEAEIKTRRASRARFLQNYRTNVGGSREIYFESTIRAMRDKSTIEPLVREGFKTGIETGLWVLTLLDGRTVESPIFSGAEHLDPREHIEINRAFSKLVNETREPIVSAAFYHNHPTGFAIPSRGDFDNANMLAQQVRFIPVWHHYVISNKSGRIQIAHYGI